MKVDNLEKFFEETYQLARFKEDNASSYAEGLHTAIKRNGALTILIIRALIRPEFH